MEIDSIFDFLDDVSSDAVPSSKGEADPPESEENIIPSERTAYILFPFFIELIDQFKETLKRLRNQTQLFQGKPSEKEFSTYISQLIGEDIKKIDLLQNSLFNYIRINNPTIKANTVNILIEEELKKHQAILEEKKIKLLKTLENDLPEAAVPDDQLRFIFSFTLQYIMTSIPRNGYFGVYTRSGALRKELAEGRDLGKREEKYIEILLMYTWNKKQVTQLGPALEIPAYQREGVLDLTLRLIDEIVKKNRGSMKFEVDEKMLKTTISLKFFADRRKVACYQAAAERSPNVHKLKSAFEKSSA